MSETTTFTPDLPYPLGPVHFQVTLDCTDPHGQARFWAAAIGYQVEVHEEMIRDYLDKGWISQDDVVTVEGRLSWHDAAAIRPAGADLAEVRRNGGRLLFMKVPEPKTVKDRMHLDLRVGPGLREAEVKRLESLGATVLYEHDEQDGHWVTLQDPEGNEFCVNEL